MTHFWTRPLRFLVFLLASTSIWALLAEFYGLCSMRAFTGSVFLPALALLGVLVLADLNRGTGYLWRSVVIGTLGGLAAAFAYDLFRVPFVFASLLHLDGILPALPLFKVFARFGAMILGQGVEQEHYSWPARFIGWTYHFSNGATFGVMYMAMIGDATKRHWVWAVLWAVGLELGMLLTPYPAVFGIRVSAEFVAVTLTAHLIFGVVLGQFALRSSRWMRRWAGKT